jgi:hypothetical protein
MNKTNRRFLLSCLMIILTACLCLCIASIAWAVSLNF